MAEPEVVETIDMSFGWGFAAQILAMNLLDGDDYDVRRDSAEDVRDMGVLLQYAVDFIKSQGTTPAFVATLPKSMRDRFVRVTK